MSVWQVIVLGVACDVGLFVFLAALAANGKRLRNRRQAAEPDYDPGAQACEHTLHSNDDHFRLWTRELWNDMNSKETS